MANAGINGRVSRHRRLESLEAEAPARGRSARMSAQARGHHRRPKAPRLSATSCRTSRKRAAPSASSSAISRRRVTPRAINRLATLLQPMSRRKPTAPAGAPATKLPVLDQVVVQRNHVHAVAGVVLRIPDRECLRDASQIGLCLRHGHARLHPPDDEEVVAADVTFDVVGNGGPDPVSRRRCPAGTRTTVALRRRHETVDRSGLPCDRRPTGRRRTATATPGRSITTSPRPSLSSSAVNVRPIAGATPIT